MPRNPVPYLKRLEGRFWSKVDKSCSSGCWKWLATLSGAGYGQFRVHSRWVGAHRVSWQLSYGDIPEGKLVLHKCDVKNCVNPDHLYIGTHPDNREDSMLRDSNSLPHRRVFYAGEICLMRNLREAGYIHSLIGKIFRTPRVTMWWILAQQQVICREGYYI